MPTPLPVNPFSTLASETRVGAAAGPSLSDPSVAAADNFARLADDPLPLFLTEPNPRLERELTELLRTLTL